MPKVKTSRIKYPQGWELIEPTLRELETKMREAENDPNDGKRKCEALWPIFHIAHQKSRYVYDLYYRREEISRELYEFCLEQGYADRNLIAKWKKDSCKSFSSYDGIYFSSKAMFGFKEINEENNEKQKAEERELEVESPHAFSENCATISCHPGYERLCCLRCIQPRDHNYATTCVCRVPKHLREEKVIECVHCGCRGCASGD